MLIDPTPIARWPIAMFVAVFLADAAIAEDIDVDLELVLAVDVSRSMDADEQTLQRQGYASAFRHSEVIQAIRRGVFGRIAVTYFEWAGPGFRSLVVPWTMVADREDGEEVAALLEAAPLTHESGTSISSGLFFSLGQFNGNGFRGTRRAVDVSGDGPNNAGYPVYATRELVVRHGVTINGLAIMLDRGDVSGADGIPNLDIYYQDCVIGGPGAFMITVDDPDHFVVAVRRKLVLEIAGLPARVIPAANTLTPEPRVDCLIGERARRAWIRRDR